MTAKTQFPAPYRHSQLRGYSTRRRAKRVGLLFRAGVDPFIHLTNCHETPTVWLAVQFVGYRGKQDAVPALRDTRTEH